MKNMSEPANNGSDDSGSLEDLIEDVPSANGGETDEIKAANSKEIPDGYVPKDQYENLQEKLGEQGNELGKLREYVNDLEPLMEKMRSNEPLIDAIFDDKITPEMAQAILAGKVSIGEANKIATANAEVKKELGTKEYDKSTPEQIEALIAKKVQEGIEAESRKLSSRIDDREEERVFTEGIKEFIKNTPDYVDYAVDIAQFFKDNPKQSDIRIAYKAVKADSLEKALNARNGKDAAFYAKELAMNNAGTDARGKSAPSGRGDFEDFVSGAGNPNA